MELDGHLPSGQLVVYKITEHHDFMCIKHDQEFTELQERQNDELTKCCETFFDLLDNFAETKNKHRHAIWPLQIMLLILMPKVLEEIVNADAGAPCSPRHLKKKHFIDAIKKALQTHGSNKTMTEAAAITY